MRDHYATNVTIRYYRQPLSRVERQGNRILVEDSPTDPQPFEISKWKEPPHVALANFPPDGKALLAFTRRYGVVSHRDSGGRRYVLATDIRRFQVYLRQAWEGNEKALDQMRVDERVSLFAEPFGIEIRVNDLWTLTRVMFLQDWLEGRAKVCASKGCKTPCFVESRKGQKFCSQVCAVRENVRRFRERVEAYHQSREAQAKRLIKERKEQAQRIRRAIRGFIEGKPETTDWRKWVAAKARVSLAELGRSLDRGKRGRPDGVKLTKRESAYLKEPKKGEN
jgi:hypothetical protein